MADSNMCGTPSTIVDNTISAVDDAMADLRYAVNDTWDLQASINNKLKPIMVPSSIDETAKPLDPTCMPPALESPLVMDIRELTRQLGRINNNYRDIIQTLDL